MNQNRKLILLLWSVGFVALILAAVLWYLRVERDRFLLHEPEYLTQVSNALLLYQIDHDGNYPKDLSAIQERTGISSKDFRKFQQFCRYLAGDWDNRSMPPDAIVAYVLIPGNENAQMLVRSGHVIIVPAKLLDGAKTGLGIVLLLVDSGHGRLEIRRHALAEATSQPSTRGD